MHPSKWVRPSQVKAARALLGLTGKDFGRLSKVGSSSIDRYETSESTPNVSLATATLIRGSFEAHGVDFIDDGARYGVFVDEDSVQRVQGALAQLPPEVKGDEGGARRMSGGRAALATALVALTIGSLGGLGGFYAARGPHGGDSAAQTAALDEIFALKKRIQVTELETKLLAIEAEKENMLKKVSPDSKNSAATATVDTAAAEGPGATLERISMLEGLNKVSELQAKLLATEVEKAELQKRLAAIPPQSAAPASQDTAAATPHETGVGVEGDKSEAKAAAAGTSETLWRFRVDGTPEVNRMQTTLEHGGAPFTATPAEAVRHAPRPTLNPTEIKLNADSRRAADQATAETAARAEHERLARQTFTVNLYELQGNLPLPHDTVGVATLKNFDVHAYLREHPADLSALSHVEGVAKAFEPMPHEVGNQVPYLSGVESSSETGKTDLIHSVVQTGITSNVIVRPRSNDKLVVQVAYTNIKLVRMEDFASGEWTLQRPVVERYGFLQQIEMESGETLVFKRYSTDMGWRTILLTVKRV